MDKQKIKAVIDVRYFRDITTSTDKSRFCDIHLDLEPGSDGTIIEINGVRYIRVTGVADLEFRLSKGITHDLAPYIPLGIAFRESSQGNGSAPHPRGTDTFDFKSLKLHDDRLSITDLFAGVKKGTLITYEFFILIQEKNSAKIGIVDPGVDNSDSPDL
jgi:hypothetical protein